MTTEATAAEREFAVKRACSAADIHLMCSFPRCTCKQIPAAVDALLAAGYAWRTEATGEAQEIVEKIMRIFDADMTVPRANEMRDALAAAITDAARAAEERAIQAAIRAERALQALVWCADHDAPLTQWESAWQQARTALRSDASRATD